MQESEERITANPDHENPNDPLFHQRLHRPNSEDREKRLAEATSLMTSVSSLTSKAKSLTSETQSLTSKAESLTSEALSLASEAANLLSDEPLN